MIRCDRDPAEAARVSFYGPHGARLDLCAHHARYVVVPRGWFRLPVDPVPLGRFPIVRAVESEVRELEYGPELLDLWQTPE